MYGDEFIAKKKLARSIVAARPLRAGEVLTAHMVSAKTHAESGLNPFDDHLVLGKKLVQDIDEDELILEHHVS